MTLLRIWKSLWWLVVFLLAACAAPRAPLTDGAEPTQWQGRLAVKVWSQPMQAFTAGFELQGSPQDGSMVLTSPLGTTVAHMQWSAGGASLDAPATKSTGTQYFASLQDLARHAMGVDVPVAQFFAWMLGKNAQAPDWTADLTGWPDGRITATRNAEPQAELKILIER